MKQILAAFTIFFLSASPALAMVTPMFNVIQVGNITGTRYYSCYGGSSVQNPSNYTVPAQVMPIAGVLSNAQVYLTAAPGAGITWTDTLYKNGVATAISIVISGTNTTGTDTTHTVTFAPADTCAWQAVSSGGTPAASNLSISSVFTGTNAGESLVMGGNAVVSTTAVNYFSVTGGGGVTTEATSSEIVPTNGVLDQLYVYGSSGTGVGTVALTLVKNGTPTALTCTENTTTGACTDLTHSVSIAATDTVSIQSTPTGSPTGPSVAWGMRFKPTIDGESMILDRAGALTTATTRNFTVHGGGSTITTEFVAQAPAPVAFTLKNFYVGIDIAPAAAKTWSYVARKGGVSQTVTCTVPALGTTCSDTTHSDSFALNDLFNWQYTSSGSPTAYTVGKYSAVVFVQPAVSATGVSKTIINGAVVIFNNGIWTLF